MIYFYFDEVKDIKIKPEYYIPDDSTVWIFNPHSNKLQMQTEFRKLHIDYVQEIKTIKCFVDDNIFNKFFASVLKKTNNIPNINEKNVLFLSFCKEYNDLIEFGFMLAVFDKPIVPDMDVSIQPTLSWNKNKLFNLI